GDELAVLVDDEDDLGVGVLDEAIHHVLDLIELLLVHHHLRVDHRSSASNGAAPGAWCSRDAVRVRERFYPKGARWSKVRFRVPGSRPLFPRGPDSGFEPLEIAGSGLPRLRRRAIRARIYSCEAGPCARPTGCRHGSVPRLRRAA